MGLAVNERSKPEEPKIPGYGGKNDRKGLKEIYTYQRRQ